jgi:hypothetical protein
MPKEENMRIKMGRSLLAIVSAFMVATPLYAADRPSTENAPSKESQSGKTPGITPQTGGEALSKKDAEVVRGKILKAGDEVYMIETSPGTQVTIRTGSSTKFESGYKGGEGDWVEALVSPDMHLETLKKSIPAYTTEGHVLTVDKEFFVVKNSAGKEIRLNIGGDSAIQGNYKVGDRIRAEFTPEGKTLSIKPAKPPVGPPGA